MDASKGYSSHLKLFYPAADWNRSCNDIASLVGQLLEQLSSDWISKRCGHRDGVIKDGSISEHLMYISADASLYLFGKSMPSGCI